MSAETVGDRWGRDSDELPIVLTGGPADGHWYRRDDFTQRQTTARRMAAIHHRSPLDPASWPLLYMPTATVTSHRRDPTRQRCSGTGPVPPASATSTISPTSLAWLMQGRRMRRPLPDTTNPPPNRRSVESERTEGDTACSPQPRCSRAT
jgi:hypothetical protein